MINTLPDINLQVKNIPEELKGYDQWVVWVPKLEEDKINKIPVNPYNGRYASTRDNTTWGDFDSAYNLYKQNAYKYGGIGFVFTDNDPFVGIDIDSSVDLKREIKPEWLGMINELNSYTEISPSGKGLHILIKGELPPGKRVMDGFEIYNTGRFFTITGVCIEGVSQDIETRNDIITSLYNKHENNGGPLILTNFPDMTDDELIEKAKLSKNGDKFKKLWEGDWSNYSSPSEADEALCCILAFWTQCDFQRIDYHFRQSGLMRPKWDERHYADGSTYGQVTIDKAIKLEEARMKNNLHQYDVVNNRIVFRKNADTLIPLSNFNATIVEEVVLDDGERTTLAFKISGSLYNKKPLPQIQVPADKYPSMSWVASEWGAEAVIEPGNTNKDRLRAAIQYLSTDIKSTYEFTHLGWRKINGSWVYLHSGGAAGGEDIKVNVTDGLRPYKLPDSVKDTKEALKSSKNLLDIAQKSITIPLWAAVYRAPTACIEHPSCTLFAYGDTGSLKSTTAGLFLSHYGGPFYSNNLTTSWLSTDNQLEKLLFLARDSVVVIDDYAPETNQKAAADLEKKVSRILRSIGNHTAKGRLNTDLSERIEFKPNAMVISTGEMLPLGINSVAARILPVPFERKNFNIEMLTNAQKYVDDLPVAMRAYIEWLAPQMDDLHKKVPERIKELRNQITVGGHLRVPEIVANLYIGLELGFNFLEEMDVITHSEVEEWQQKGWETLLELAKYHTSLLTEEKPTIKFLSALSTLLAQGKVYLTERKTGTRHIPTINSHSNHIGWVDEKGTYLLPQAAYSEVNDLLKSDGGFPLSERALIESLVKDGWAFRPKDRNTIKIRVGGKTHRVLHLTPNALEEVHNWG